MSRYFPSMKKHSWIILVCTVIGLIIGGAVAKAQPPAYIVTASLLVNNVPNFEYGTSTFTNGQSNSSQSSLENPFGTNSLGLPSAKSEAVTLAISDLTELSTRSLHGIRLSI